MFLVPWLILSLLRNFLNQYQINLLPTHHPQDVFCILFMIFFVCCLFVTMMFNSLLKAGLLMIFRQNKLLHFLNLKNLFFFSSLSPTVLQSNRIHYYFL